MEDTKFILVKFLGKKKWSKDAYSFYFEKPGGFDFLPGQYTKLILPLKNPDVRGDSRYFTIAASPTERDLMITTRVIKSTFKKALHRLSIGAKVKIRRPFGTLVLNKDEKRPIVLISGGIGITPARSMLIYAKDKRLGNQITLLASFSNEEELIFDDELVKLKNKNLNINFINSSKNGKLNREKIEKLVVSPYDSVYFITGSTVFTESMEKMLRKMGIKDENFEAEYFPGY